MARLVFLLATLSLATSCASIFRGSTESYTIETKPSGAVVSVEHSGGVEACTSPCVVKVKRKGPLVVTITKEGYKDYATTVESTMDRGSAAGSVFGGGLFGMGIDAKTGALNSHKPNPLVVELEREQP